MNAKIEPEHLQRGATIYIRQSTRAQVVSNIESQHRQYGLKDRAQLLGFKGVQVIDEDLGKSGSGTAERPGFQKLVAAVCAEEIGAIFCIEASRLARNGREWHSLMELCALVGTLIIDSDGVYDPRTSNDRLLLGIKGSMNEFELHLLRQRSLGAIRSKAKRGELEVMVPVGLVWEDGVVRLDPDRRVQEAIRLVFSKFHELRTIRQVWLWSVDAGLQMPVRNRARSGGNLQWMKPAYHRLRTILTHPAYAGAYTYGRTETRTRLIDGRPSKVIGQQKPREDWLVLIQDHHPGYISWDQHEEIRAILLRNTHVMSNNDKKSGRGGRALLSGILRCRRCGRMFGVRYAGTNGQQHRYICRGDALRTPGNICCGVGGKGVDRAIGEAVLAVLKPLAVEAAHEAHRRVERQGEAVAKARALELEEARYRASLASRRYDKVDPENRLVADELEARWNAALQEVDRLEKRASEERQASNRENEPDLDALLAAGSDLTEAWRSSDITPATRQRLVSALIEEVIVDDEKERGRILLTVHWAGGRHTTLELAKRRHSSEPRTSLDAVQVVSKMAGKWPDRQVASTLNRLQLRTATGQSWNQVRVRALRHRNDLPGFDPAALPNSSVPLMDAALRLGISTPGVKKLIAQGILRGHQDVPFGPWSILISDIETKTVQEAADRSKKRRPPGRKSHDASTLPLPGFH